MIGTFSAMIGFFSAKRWFPGAPVLAKCAPELRADAARSHFSAGGNFPRIIGAAQVIELRENAIN